MVYFNVLVAYYGLTRSTDILITSCACVLLTGVLRSPT